MITHQLPSEMKIDSVEKLSVCKYLRFVAEYFYFIAFYLETQLPVVLFAAFKLSFVCLSDICICIIVELNMYLMLKRVELYFFLDYLHFILVLV